MSISWYIYKAPPEAGPIYEWDSDQSERVGALDVVKGRLSKVFPKLTWGVFSYQVEGKDCISHFGSGSDYNPDDEYLDLSLSVDSEGFVQMIIGRKASPKVVIAIMEEFGLDNVYQDQPGVMVDPYAFEGNWKPKNG